MPNGRRRPGVFRTWKRAGAWWGRFVAAGTLIWGALLAVVILCAAAGPVPAQERPTTGERIIFTATPAVLVQSGRNDTERTTLSPAQRDSFRVTIVEQDGRYYWRSREGRELRCVQSGTHTTTFYDPRGSGYVKVVVPWPSEKGAEKPRRYVEHVNLGPFGTFTYWGRADVWRGGC